MTERPDRLPLSARPKWIVPKIFKWLANLVGWGALIVFAAALVHDLTTDAEEVSVDELILNDTYYVTYSFWYQALEGILVFSSVLLLWLISLVADRIDQLVWLTASRIDQDEILARRKGGSENKIG